MKEPLLTSRELAARWNMKVNTLEAWRARGLGPAYVKMHSHRGAPVRYRLQDVIDYEVLMKITPVGVAFTGPEEES